MLPDFTFSEGNVIYPGAKRYEPFKVHTFWLIKMMAITLEFKNVILDLVSADQHTPNEVTFLMPCVL